MFSITNEESQLNLFSNTHTFLSRSSLRLYEDTQSWHNLFRTEVTLRIDEDLFRPLFCSNNGAPNACIRVLIAMMILKEARGLSDSQLFEECRFNLLVRSALGLPNIDDSIPADSTYYLLRRRIVDWEKAGNDNLIEKVFAQVTQSQAIDFKINGKNIRMDSKLIGSNIAWYSRYELIHESLRKAYPCIQSVLHLLLLSESESKLLESICKESGDKVIYRSSKAELESKMSELGSLIYKITRQMSNHPAEAMQILCRVFSDQYFVKEDDIIPRPKEEIRSGSVQSPHDTECHYRNKGGNHIKGYSINVTETCDGDSSLNLVTSVQVDVAGAADNDFLQSAIESSQEIVQENIQIVNADGAYHSIANQDYCREKDIDFVVGAIQGKPSRYDLSYDENAELVVTDLQTNTIVPSRRIESRKNEQQPKWAIKDEKGRNRYFSQKEIDTCLLRKQTGNRSQTELNVRNNVEATIFQLGYHYSNDKSRYRGLVKHRIWANVRCLWINFVRILNFIVKSVSNNTRNSITRINLYLFLTIFIETILVQCSVKKNCQSTQKIKLRRE